MKRIGHSVSRCVNDVLAGKVDDRDIELVIGATRFDPNPAGVQLIITAYVREGTWNEADRPRITEILTGWIDTGRLHQPRNTGAYAGRSYNTWTWSVPTPENMTPSAKEAWDSFLTISALGKEQGTSWSEIAQELQAQL